MNKINPNHTTEKSFLKIAGPLVLIIGIVLFATGLISFFSSFGSFRPPKYFWCCFVGVPTIAIGGAMTKFAYMGKIARYSAEELAPVAKDTFNYVAKESSKGISTLVHTIKESSNDTELNNIEKRIATLEELHKKGMISKEEFEKQKNRILSEI